MTGRELSVGRRVSLTALPGIPIVQAGDDLVALIRAALARAEITLTHGDVLVVTSKLFSRAEGCFVDLGALTVSERAASLAAELDKDPALVELILRDTERISRQKPGALIVRHRLGFISANAAVDASNARPEGADEGSGPWALTVIVNSGDDFDHWGLRICPDHDTVMYTLCGEADMGRGWGLRDETFRALDMVRRYGGDDWFMLGDKDLGTHLARTVWRSEGVPAAEISRRLCSGLGVSTTLLPAGEGRRTVVDTVDGRSLDFQDWLVGERAEPRVRAIRFVSDSDAPTGAGEGVLEAIAGADLVVLCPSNPYVSIDPILTLPGVRDALGSRCVIGVSPIAGGRAVKGPLATMIPDLTGAPASAVAIAQHYGALLKGLVVETGDQPAALTGETCRYFETGIIMGDESDRVRLAREVLAFAEALR